MWWHTPVIPIFETSLAYIVSVESASAAWGKVSGLSEWEGLLLKPGASHPWNPRWKERTKSMWVPWHKTVHTTTTGERKSTKGWHSRERWLLQGKPEFNPWDPRGRRRENQIPSVVLCHRATDRHTDPEIHTHDDKYIRAHNPNWEEEARASVVQGHPRYIGYIASSRPSWTTEDSLINK